MPGQTYPSPPSDCSTGSSSPETSPRVLPVNLCIMDEQVSPPPVEHVSSRPRLAIKRDREPPKNSVGEFYCDHPDCRGLTRTFRRPCEWNKHMDKHDRPYKCQNPDCDKLAGFTYSGGLLRHQREVHKMHSQGKRLMCPVPSCNRSSGKGFTRQENLKEHIRRLHRGYDGASRDLPIHQLQQRHNISNDNITTTNNGNGNDVHDRDSDVLKKNDTDNSVFMSPTSRSGKRRRTSDGSGLASDEDIQSLREELRRLRRETQEKDSRLDELEKVVKEMKQKMHTSPERAE